MVLGVIGKGIKKLVKPKKKRELVLVLNKQSLILGKIFLMNTVKIKRLILRLKILQNLAYSQNLMRILMD